MTTHALTTTAEDLWNLPDDGMRRELVEGRLRVMSPAGFEHGRVAATAGILLGSHVRATGSGATLGAETGFILASDPDTVRAPDAAFVSQTRVDAVGRTDGFWPDGAPDLAIEVVSPEDSRPYVRSKALHWLEAGATAVLVLNPRSRSATVYRPGGDIRSFTDGTLDLSDAVPGWRVAVADFFD
ncbi:MAG TPA: Uma2 family endonuclease [Solirubrobacteraceae bacterium]|nr:Uma2 family endonuclease [Solirubrobacteraceae bacterium]